MKVTLIGMILLCAIGFCNVSLAGKPLPKCDPDTPHNCE